MEALERTNTTIKDFIFNIKNKELNITFLKEKQTRTFEVVYLDKKKRQSKEVYGDWTTVSSSEFKRNFMMNKETILNFNKTDDEYIVMFKFDIIDRIRNEGIFVPRWFWIEKHRREFNKIKERKTWLQDDIERREVQISELMQKRSKLDVEAEILKKKKKTKKLQPVNEERGYCNKEIKKNSEAISKAKFEITELEQDIKRIGTLYKIKTDETDESLSDDDVFNDFKSLKDLFNQEFKKYIGVFVLRNRETGHCLIQYSKDILRSLTQYFERKSLVPKKFILYEDYFKSSFEDKMDIFEVKIIACAIESEKDTIIDKALTTYNLDKFSYNNESVVYI